MWLYLNRIDKKSPHIKGVKFSPFSATNAIDMFQYAKKLYEKDKTDKIRAWQKWAKTQAALGVNHSPDEWEEFWRTKILPVFQRDLPKDEDPPTVTSMDGSGDLPVSTKVYGKRKSGKRKRDDIFAVSSSPPPALSPAGKLAKRPKVHRSGEKPIRPASPVRKASPEIPYAPKLPIKPVVPDPSSGGMADEESVAENTPIVIESDDDEEELSISPSPESKREEDDEQAALDAQLLGESSYVQLRSSPKKPTKKVLGTEIPETQFTQVKSQISATPSDHDETVPGSSPPFEAFSPEPPNPTDVDIDETPFSPLPDEISDIVSDEEDNQASQESSTASKVEDAWIENHINAGRNPEDLIVAITAICSEGAFDQELADFVLGFYRNSGRIPQNRRGVWTEADDEKLNSGHVADLENVVAKHGEDAVGKRSGFLRSRDE